jgi:hypothetical protein
MSLHAKDAVLIDLFEADTNAFLRRAIAAVNDDRGPNATRSLIRQAIVELADGLHNSLQTWYMAQAKGDRHVDKPMHRHHQARPSLQAASPGQLASTAMLGPPPSSARRPTRTATG